jgi:Glutaredoxin and related proteins
MIAVIYSKDNCPFCEKAKHLLASHNIEYAENKVGVDVTREELLELVPHARTVPQIFLYGNYIGTYQELVQYFENNTTGSTEGKL